MERLPVTSDAPAPTLDIKSVSSSSRPRFCQTPEILAPLCSVIWGIRQETRLVDRPERDLWAKGSDWLFYSSRLFGVDMLLTRLKEWSLFHLRQPESSHQSKLVSIKLYILFSLQLIHCSRIHALSLKALSW